MCEKIDPLLIKYGFTIDRFKGAKKDKNTKVYLLTHAHRDHMMSLSNAWRQETHGVIIASEDTANLVKLKYPDITGLTAILPNQWVTYGGASIMALPTRHCIGAVMFVFAAEDQIVLYTGDFRFEYKSDVPLQVLQGMEIDRMYIDDTYAKLDQVFPSTAESVSTLIHTITMLNDGKNPVYINVRSIGQEMLLKAAAEKMKISYRLGYPEDHVNHRLLQYTLGDHIDPTSNIVLSIPHKDTKKQKGQKWIMLTCSSKACGSPFKSLKASKICVPIFFCQHSSRFEIKRFTYHLFVNEVIPCGHAVTCASY